MNQCPGRGGHFLERMIGRPTLFRSQFLKLLSSLDLIFTFLSIPGHIFFSSVSFKAIKMWFLVQSMLQVMRFNVQIGRNFTCGTP